MDRIRLRCSSEAVLEIGSKDRLLDAFRLDAEWNLLKKIQGRSFLNPYSPSVSLVKALLNPYFSGGSSTVGWGGVG